MNNRFTLRRFYTITLLLFVGMFGGYGELQAQCNINDGTSPVIGNCNDMIISLDPGECSSPINPQVFATDNCNDPQFSYTNISASTPSGGFGCDMGTTSFYTMFNSDSQTPFTPTEVTFVVYNVANPYAVDVRIWKTNGSTSQSDWDMVGSGQASVTPSVGGTASANITTIMKVNYNEEMAVEIVSPAIANGDTLVAYSTDVTQGSSVVSPACGITSPWALSTALNITGTSGAMVTLAGESDAVLLEPMGASRSHLDFFEEGLHTISLMAVDAAGNTSTCSFDLEVEGIDNPVTSITCNDLVNISLDNECKAIVGADEILEGGPYSCFDEYVVTIYNTSNRPIGDSLDASYVGEILKVEVTAPNGNLCWGEIRVEDKNPPKLECGDVYTTCLSTLEPGSAQPINITYEAQLNGGEIDAAAPSSNEYSINVFGLRNVTYRDVNVIINIDHDSPSSLTATLEDPNGRFITLFSGLTCTNGDLRFTLDDGASSTQADLQAFCNGVNPAITGSFQPSGTLDLGTAEDPSGEWKITINDTNGGVGGTVNKLAIVLKQIGGFIPFPTENDVTFTKIQGTNNNFRVEGIDPCGQSIVSYNDNVIDMDCDTIYSMIVERTWNAIDASGNEAIPCTQIIYVYRNGLETLVLPPNYDGIDRPSFSCEVYGDRVPRPIPSEAGYPEGEFCDNVQIFDPEDTRIDICNKSYKLIRQWKIIEWCTGEVIEHTQVIKVEDKEGPDIEDIDDDIISADIHDCMRDYTPEQPEATDNCSEDDQLTYRAEYATFPVGSNDPKDLRFYPVPANGTILDLPLATTRIRWTVTDDCGNTSTAEYDVTVEDNVPPVPVCDQFTNVSVGSDGTARLDPFTLDDGSYDNCELDKYEIAKMSNRCSGENTRFDMEAIFCCDEIGTNVMVALRVTDAAGNSNTCMVEVTVEDKLPPFIECPDDITLLCIDNVQDTSLTGTPFAIDNCGLESVTFTDNDGRNSCGVGLVRRTWTAKERDYDGPGGVPARTASCTQRIEVIDDGVRLVERDIDWPDDYDTNECRGALHPDSLDERYAYPRLRRDIPCSQISYEYWDQTFTFVDGSCEKILRTWTLIDWCTYDNRGTADESDDLGIYTDVQVLKLENNEAPMIANCPRFKFADVFGDCEGEVADSIVATDDCTPDDLLWYEYTIDEFNDGVGRVIRGSGSKFTEELSIGEHKVTWTVEDQCGNQEICMYILRVRDGKKPTPYCLTTVTTVVMPSTRMIDIWAVDFDYGSFDNCTPQNELEFSFSPNINDKSMSFHCDSILDGEEQYFPLRMYVHDNAGNSDFCSIGVIVQDGIDDVCDEVMVQTLSGRLATEENELIADAKVEARTMVNEVMISSTTSGGNGQFSLDVFSGNDVLVSAEKDGDYLNGVSTLDLVLIQRHILGIKEFNAPFKAIAADVNDDEKISAGDLVGLRKVILGIDSEFPNGQHSWRFVDGSQTFHDVNKPFPYKGHVELYDVNTTQQNVDLVGVKIGDVNASAKANLRSEHVENRSAGVTELEYISYKDGAFIRYDIYATNDAVLSGLQASFNALSGEIINVESGALNIQSSDLNSLSDKVKMSVALSENIDVLEGEVLFSIVTSDAQANAELTISDDLNAESYNQAYEVSRIVLKRSSDQLDIAFDLKQNTPNPFSDQTSISFILPNEGQASLEVYDMTGKIIYTKTEYFQKGEHTIKLNQEDLELNGVLFYQLTFGKYKATKKMVSVR